MVLELCESESDSVAVGSENPCYACGGDSVALVLSPPVVNILEEEDVGVVQWHKDLKSCAHRAKVARTEKMWRAPSTDISGLPL